MHVLRADDHYLLRLVPGEELHECVHGFCAQEAVDHAAVFGIGAIEQIELGAWDIPTKHYTRRRFDQAMELVSLQGNVSWVDGSPSMHAHVCISGHDFVAWAGHLFTSRVYATVELWLRPGRGRVERAMDDYVGLKLLALPESCRFGEAKS
jgi:predicted DNA-binding protein with PD1-like motif